MNHSLNNSIESFTKLTITAMNQELSIIIATFLVIFIWLIRKLCFLPAIVAFVFYFRMNTSFGNLFILFLKPETETLLV